jgi:hypothetical protein
MAWRIVCQPERAERMQEPARNRRLIDAQSASQKASKPKRKQFQGIFSV